MKVARICALALVVTLVGAGSIGALDLSIGGSFGGNLGAVNSDRRQEINEGSGDIANMIRFGLDVGFTARALFGGTFGVQSGAMYFWRTGGLRTSGSFPDPDDPDDTVSNWFRVLDRIHVLRIPALGVARFSMQDEIWLAPHAGAMVDFLIGWEQASGFGDAPGDLDGEYDTLDPDSGWRQPAFSWAVGFDVEYEQDDERWTGAIGPRFSRSLTSFGPDDDDSDTDKRFTTYGISISVNYEL